MARSIGVPYAAHRLTADASYNVRLGTAYLQDLLDRFGNSYELAVAAYNAGPARVGEWLRTYGDPRGRAADDMVDWIES
ncbi:transglycosylase SLT domain-containing protein, partial [Acinetobacter baumannii]